MEAAAVEGVMEVVAVRMVKEEAVVVVVISVKMMVSVFN
jgi:hypothetical protein